MSMIIYLYFFRNDSKRRYRIYTAAFVAGIVSSSLTDASLPREIETYS